MAEFDKVWSAMRVRGCGDLQPVSLLMSLVLSPEEAHLLAQHWKLSNCEKKLGVFVVEHRQLGYREDLPVKVCQDLLVDGAQLKSVLELLLYCNRTALAHELEQWPLPKFPVNGRDLQLVGLKPGPGFGRMMKQLRAKWKESYFTLSKDDLLETAAREHRH